MEGLSSEPQPEAVREEDDLMAEPLTLFVPDAVESSQGPLSI